MNANEVLQSIKLCGEKDKEFLKRLGRTSTPVVLLPQKGQNVTEVEIEGRITEREIKNLDSTLAINTFSFLCDSRVINNFTVGGNSFTAKQFSFSVDTISWQAGDRWPVYTRYCPVDSYGQNNYYRDAKSHQIVPGIKGQNYFIGCSSSGTCESVGVGQITFAVNDTSSYYEDNRGFFEVTIYSWS